MSRLAPGKRTALLAAAAALLALGPARSAPASGATAPTCRPGQLTALFVNSSGAAGSIDVEYGFGNHSTRSCVLRGFPRLQMLASSGSALPTTEMHAPGAYGIATSPVTLAPRKVGYFGVHYPSATGFGHLHCPSSAALMALTRTVPQWRCGIDPPYG